MAESRPLASSGNTPRHNPHPAFPQKKSPFLNPVPNHERIPLCHVALSATHSTSGNALAMGRSHPCSILIFTRSNPFSICIRSHEFAFNRVAKPL
jgi:hypothetical protein